MQEHCLADGPESRQGWQNGGEKLHLEVFRVTPCIIVVATRHSLALVVAASSSLNVCSTSEAERRHIQRCL